LDFDGRKAQVRGLFKSIDTWIEELGLKPINLEEFKSSKMGRWLGNGMKCSGGKEWGIFMKGAVKAGKNNVILHTILKKWKVWNSCVSVQRHVMKM
ncbi:hypothetical protein Ddye_020811, partial [Dipteronia dyeriana]